MSEHGVLIVGAGAAGTAAATELRNHGFVGPITIVNGEAVAPYNRTTVNKALLQPDADLARVRQPVPTEERTVLLTGVAAASADLEARAVELRDGTRLGYDRLLVASGAVPRELRVPVAPTVADRVTTLRTAAHAARVRQVLEEVGARQGRRARVCVVGAGLLGSETADALTELGHEVYLVDPSPTPLARLLGPTVGQWVGDRHRLHLGAVLEDEVVAVESSASGPVVRLAGGLALEVDLLVVSAGVEPDTAWLAGGPLGASGGVVTDDRLRALGAPGVYAAGDVARVGGGSSGAHWAQALRQGAHAARVIAHDLGLGDDPGPVGGTPSYATRLYGRPISVVGTVDEGRCVDVVDDPQGGLCVTGFVREDDALGGLVVLGPAKVANKLRPLVAERASLADLAGRLEALRAVSPTIP